MADEVSTGELGRRLDEVLRTVQGLVSRPEYTADQRHWEHRFADIERELSDVNGEIQALQNHNRQQSTQRGADWRQAIYAGLIPSILVVVGILVQTLRGN